MARKKKKSKKKKPVKQWFAFGGKSTAKKKTKATKTGPGRRVVVMAFLVLCILSVVAAGFVFLDRYVRKITLSSQVGPLQFIDRPYWFNNELLQKAQEAAGGSEFALNETVARAVAENLKLVPWLYDVKVQTTSSSVEVKSKYRRPAGLIKRSGKTHYIDHDAVVLPFLPIENLTIVEIKGFLARTIPTEGVPMTDNDIAAAIKLLYALETMDRISTPDAPLLKEIESIDVSNLDGRRNRHKAHIVLYAKDGTQVNWGAAYGRSARYLEASDKEKVAMLYEFYTQNGTIQGIVKYIDLRNPQETVPRPTTH